MAKKEADVAAKKDAANSSKPASESGFNVNNFLQETKEELNKVVWPSRQQLISESLAVVLMVILSTTLIYLVDNFFAWAAGQVFR
ncbi:MAG: preprotein translocase subunit SecE [Leptolyngbyaceae cyanobacterium bins.349]|nr:preprotein translocase subunit SecE [Leptolyngbyaceae cyanobacterium bins.349]